MPRHDILILRMPVAQGSCRVVRHIVAFLSFLLLPLVVEAAPLRPLPALLHAHSTFSTGDLPLDRLVTDAQRQGLEAILLTENYLLRVQYGLWPFRAATRLTQEEPSVLSQGVETYLAHVSEVRRRFPAMVIVPGVEVNAHYYWTGSPFTGDLTNHDFEKKLHVFGVEDPAALKRLPITGNPYLRRYTAWSVVDVLPGLLIFPGLWLILVGRRRRRRLGGVMVVKRERRWLAGGTLCVLGAVAVIRAFPFTQDPWSPYSPDPDPTIYQALIDQVESQGGITVWSFPEARDSSDHSVLGFTVRVRTDPYPDDLAQTFRYTAFGGIYEDTTRVTAPGALWDYILGKYLAGERSRPPWAVGESGFHGYVAGKRPVNVQTIFLVRDKSEAAILESFRAGRMYALSRTLEYGLVLQDFSVHQGAAEAISGETLGASGNQPLEVRIKVSASDGGEYPIRAILVGNGKVVNAWTSTTPFNVVHQDPPQGAPSYFRLEVRGPVPHQVLTNPIFVRPGHDHTGVQPKP